MVAYPFVELLHAEVGQGRVWDNGAWGSLILHTKIRSDPIEAWKSNCPDSNENATDCPTKRPGTREVSLTVM